MDGKEYFKRRSVGRKVVPRVLTHKGTGWVVDSLPGGGFADDPVALLEDSRGGQRQPGPFQDQRGR